MIEEQRLPVGSHDAVRFVLYPAVVGVVVAGIALAVWQWVVIKCDSEPGDPECLGRYFVVLFGGLPVAAAVAWAALALRVGAWRAPTIVVVGGWFTALGLYLTTDVLSDRQAAPFWAAAIAGGLAFAAAGFACMPGLRRGTRIAVIVALAVTYVVTWFVV